MTVTGGTPGDLIAATAAAMLLPEKTVFQFDRKLSEAGLRTKSGRGRSAARVTAHDATNLVISILGAPLSGPGIAEAAITCQRFSSLVPEYYRETPTEFAPFGLESFSKLPSKHSLAEAIECLFESIARGEKLSGWKSGVPTYEHQPFSLVVEFSVPRRSAEIRAFGNHQYARIGYREYNLDDTVDETLERLKKLPRPDPVGDLVQTRQISYRTIEALAAVITPQGEGS